jgi:hypothetical protein
MKEIRIPIGEFAWEQITLEAKRQGVSPEALARTALVYYLADLDAGRIATRSIDSIEGLSDGWRASEPPDD